LDKIIGQAKCEDKFLPLKHTQQIGDAVPQTYPVRIIKGSRDEIYGRMNQRGYGVVSLYHTLIEPLRNSEYASSIALSKSILNLPVHQDVNVEKYSDMIDLLCKVISNSE
jgi:dTDP-4-amino-4,6-dideoxygalactose transaminase